MDTVQAGYARITEMIPEDSVPFKIILTIAAVIAVMIAVAVLKRVYREWKYWRNSNPWLFKGTKSAKRRMVIPQNPDDIDAKPLMRSNNEKGGLEFTYVFWMFVDDWSYNRGEWKHVIHKGNDTSYPLRTPGVWLHPDKNAMRVYMNTFSQIMEFVDVENLPHNKWFHVAVCVQQKNLDVFINGNLAKRKVLEGIPRQNYGDVYINAFKGFSGFMSNVRYYQYYIDFNELESQILMGPSMMPCVDSGETPPYFSLSWWANSK